MTGFEVAIVALTCAALGWIVGALMGVFSERYAWKIRAYGPGKSNTPHCCEGEFYYIVPEEIFMTEFTRKDRQELGR